MRFLYTSAMLLNGVVTLAKTSAFLVAPRSQLVRVVGLRHHVIPFSTNSHKATARQSGRAAANTMMSEQTKPSDGKFVRMGSAEDTHSFGPRCVVAAGLSAKDSTSLLSILQAEEEGSPPLVIYTSEISSERVGDVLCDAEAISRRQEEAQETSGRQSAPTLASPVILVSGFTNPELRGFVARCRQLLSVRAAFAKAVPNAMDKPMSHLCSEIAQDHANALAGKLEPPPVG